MIKKIFIQLLILMFAINSIPLIVYADVNTNNNNILRSQGKYNYYYNGETLRQALIIYSKNASLQINFASNVDNKILDKQTVTGQFSSTESTGFLNTLAKEYGFEWFIYANTLYISSNKFTNQTIEVTTDIMPIVKNNLQEIGLYNEKFSYSELPTENRIVISGPKEYTDLVLKQIKSLNLSPISEQFAIFKLKYASADDTQLTFNGQQITVPGVATILQKILNGTTPSGMNQNTTNPIKNQAAPDVDITTQNNGSNNDSKNNQNGATGANKGSPFIQADTRLNAIIIRDKTNNLSAYQSLIEKLDVPTPLIQVDVLIIRLDQDALDKAGVNWWASKGGKGLGFGLDNLKDSNKGNGLSFMYGAMNPSNLLVSNATNFLMGIDFLEQKNIAKAMGKPSIATVDNLPAIINVTQSLFTGVNGDTSGNSKQGTAQVNTSLQITPHVIFGPNNQKQIKLSMSLQDGNLTDPGSSGSNSNKVSGTLQSDITSQAVLNEGQSILLAGYTKDVSQTETESIPLLGDIPLLGWFFKSQTLKTHRLTTVYLVTPKILWMDNNINPIDSVTIDNATFNNKDNVKIN